MSQLGIAVIGAGFIGPVHVEGLRRVGADVIGVLDYSPEASRIAAKKMGLRKAYASLDEMLGDPRVDCVHIASPNRLHFEQAARSLAAGKHVVCEKPLAMTSKESARLVQIAKKSGRVAAVNYNLRYYPLCLEARERFRSGQMGRVFSVLGGFVQDWLLYDTDYNWRVLAEEGGELRAVSDIGTHWLDLVTFITGLEVEAVCADLMTVHPIRKRPLGEVETFSGKGKKAPVRTMPVKITTDDYGTVMIHFQGGARGAMTVSQTTAGKKCSLRFEIAAQNAALSWDHEAPNQLWIGYRDKPNELMIRDPSLLSPAAARFASYPGGHNEGYPDTFKQLYRDINDCIAAGGKRRKTHLFPTFEDGHRELVLCEAIAKSNKLKKWVEVK
ncbi:MAG: Gfo/Idh/MocA family oxidoreductase [Candidatus Sumerlaeota bacterium]|nr:Gfo/Idh/MocA family oxidoreductase [Candidatus Sumerlaeota bacterium]